MKEEFVRFWLFGSWIVPVQRQALVDTFPSISTMIRFIFNYKEGMETVAFREAVKAEKKFGMSARWKER